METETVQIRPSSALPSRSLTLTVYDIFFLKVYPVQFIFYYQLPDPSPENFYSVVLPKLKRSLSLVLDHFFPLAGRLVWPQNEPKPIILYTPDDSVSFTVAKASNPESFLALTGADAIDASEARRLVPELHCTDTEADPISIQVTYFCNHGISIGFSRHHGVFDGNSAALFWKAWAATNSSLSTVDDSPSLPSELLPFLERQVPEELDDLYSEMIAWWYSPIHPFCDNPRSLKCLPSPSLSPTLVRKTFNISFNEVEMIKQLVWKELEADPKSLRLSSFVVSYAFAINCFIQAKKIEDFCYIIHLRNCRLDADLPQNYFGNYCILNRCKYQVTMEDAKSNYGLASIVKEIAGSVNDSKSMTAREAAKVVIFGNTFGTSTQCFTVAFHPQFRFYEVDYGWGKPIKTEVVSVENLGSFAITGNRDGDGLHIQLVLEKDIMESFSSLFLQGLAKYCST